jgi:hypothetical protein
MDRKTCVTNIATSIVPAIWTLTFIAACDAVCADFFFGGTHFAP